MTIWEIVRYTGRKWLVLRYNRDGGRYEVKAESGTHGAAYKQRDRLREAERVQRLRRRRQARTEARCRAIDARINGWK